MAVARSTPPATGSSRSSMVRPERSAAPGPSSRPIEASGSPVAGACTRPRSSAPARRSEASTWRSLPASAASRWRTRCSHPAPCATCARDQASASRIAGCMCSRASMVNASYSRPWARVGPMRESPGTPRVDDTKTDDEAIKVHRTETKTRTPVEAKREGPTLDDIKKDDRVRVYLRSANAQTGAIGYTEHGERHATTTADGARFILKSPAQGARRTELGAVAAYLHDMGNVITREKHGQTGALLANPILVETGFTYDEI